MLSDSLIQCIWLTHLTATLYMVGLIWFVQLVHYPLLERVGISEFQTYEREHLQRTTWAVSPMVLEFLSALLMIWIRPSQIPLWSVWMGISLMLMVWFSTVFVQVPCHRQLEQGFDVAVHRRLVRSNWLRTICWSLRGGLILWMVVATSEPSSVSAHLPGGQTLGPSMLAWSIPS